MRRSISVGLVAIALAFGAANTASADPFSVSGALPPLGCQASGWVVGLPIPRHELVDAALWPAVNQACQQIRKIGLGIDAIELAGLD